MTLRCTCPDDEHGATIRCPVHGTAATHYPDPRDAEIARLKAEVERLTRDSTRFDADWSSLRGENDALRDACRAQIDAGAAGRVAALYQRAIAAESDLARHKRALAAGMTAHTRADDRVRGDLAGCRADLAVEGEVADVCMSVVEQCRALVEGHACACWRAGE